MNTSSSQSKEIAKTNGNLGTEQKPSGKLPPNPTAPQPFSSKSQAASNSRSLNSLASAGYHGSADSLNKGLAGLAGTKSSLKNGPSQPAGASSSLGNKPAQSVSASSLLGHKPASSASVNSPLGNKPAQSLASSSLGNKLAQSASASSSLGNSLTQSVSASSSLGNSLTQSVSASNSLGQRPILSSSSNSSLGHSLTQSVSANGSLGNKPAQSALASGSLGHSVTQGTKTGGSSGNGMTAPKSSSGLTIAGKTNFSNQPLSSRSDSTKLPFPASASSSGLAPVGNAGVSERSLPGQPILSEAPHTSRIIPKEPSRSESSDLSNDRKDEGREDPSGPSEPPSSAIPVRRWFVTLMCMNIPIIGWIYLIILAFSRSKGARREFAKAYLLYKLLFLFISAVILAVAVHYGLEFLDLLLSYMDML